DTRRWSVGVSWRLGGPHLCPCATCWSRPRRTTMRPTRCLRLLLPLTMTAALIATVPTAAAAATLPYEGASLPVPVRVADLLGRMTLEEKVGQMTQTERYQVFDNPSLITTWKLGSILSGGGSTPTQNKPAAWADMVDRFQAAALATRLHIPILYGIDSVHGDG